MVVEETRTGIDADRPPSLFTPAAHHGDPRSVFAPDRHPPPGGAGTHDLFSVAPTDEPDSAGVPLVAPGPTPRRWMTTLLSEIDLRDIDLRDDVPRVVRRRHRSADAPRRRGWRARFRLRRTARSVPATRRLST